MYVFVSFRSPVQSHLPLKVIQQRCASAPQQRLPFPSNALQRGEKFFSPHGIIWAGENGGCVVPLPSVLYNGKTQATEKPRYKPFVNHTYQFCGLDEQGQHPTYHGNYRCIAVVTTYWKHLASIDQKVSGWCLQLIFSSSSDEMASLRNNF